MQRTEIASCGYVLINEHIFWGQAFEPADGSDKVNAYKQQWQRCCLVRAFST